MGEQERIEGIAANIGRAIGAAVNDSVGGPGKMGFALLIFDFGDGGTMAYSSNARRADMIRALDELLVKLRA